MKELDTVKLFLIASFVLCVAGLGVYLYQVNDLKDLEVEIPRSRLKLKEIGGLYAKWKLLKEEEDRDKRHGVMLRTYLEDQGHKAGVDYNRLKLDTQSSNPNERGGYEDQPYTIMGGKTKFHRQSVAKYIFNIENYTNRLKVTELNLDKPDSNYERWTITMKLVERNPYEKGAKR